MKYGDRIRHLRESRSLSQDELAVELGTSSKYIDKIERNRIKPTLDTIELVCEKFDISLSEFFNDGKVAEVEVVKEIKHVNINGLNEILAFAEKFRSYHYNTVRISDYSDVDFKEYRMYEKGCCVAYNSIINKIEDLKGRKSDG